MAMRATSFTIGADPEIFVRDAVQARSIIGKIGGTKHDPRPLPLGKGFAVQEDNVAMEFNIPACKTKAAFVKAIADATGFLETVIKDQYGFMFDQRSAISFTDQELDDPAAHVFGCEPDYNCWTRERNPRPSAQDKNLRSCGGHIHIGFADHDPHEVVKAMDLFASVPATLMDKGELRKQLYGKAGAFRLTSFGVEYRPLSNFWIFKPRLCEWAYDAVDRALMAVSTGMSFDDDKDAILEAVDMNNKDAAMSLVAKYGLEVVNA